MAFSFWIMLPGRASACRLTLSLLWVCVCAIRVTVVDHGLTSPRHGPACDYHSTATGYDTAPASPRHPPQSTARLVCCSFLVSLVHQLGTLNRPDTRTLTRPQYTASSLLLREVPNACLEDELALIVTGLCSCSPYRTALILPMSPEGSPFASISSPTYRRILDQYVFPQICTSERLCLVCMIPRS